MEYYKQKFTPHGNLKKTDVINLLKYAENMGLLGVTIGECKTCYREIETEITLLDDQRNGKKVENSGPPPLGFDLLMGKTAKEKLVNQAQTWRKIG